VARRGGALSGGAAPPRNWDHRFVSVVTGTNRIAAFFSSATAAEDAAAFAKTAVEDAHVIVTSSGRGRVTKAQVRDYATWTGVPALSKGF